MNTSAFTFDSVTKTFPGRAGSSPLTAVNTLSLSVQPGEVVAFLGPNGAGKTTSIDMLLGLSAPTAGTVSVFGTTPREAVAKGLVTAVMQTGGLLKDLTVQEIMGITAALFPHHRDIGESLERAGIAKFARHRVEKLSGGQQQRLRFAMALLPEPQLIVLDEPTTGMDVSGRRDFWEAIRSDAKHGRTVLFATHYLEEADAYADRIVLIAEGRIVAEGTPMQIKALANTRSVRATLPLADAPTLRALPGVDAVDVNGSAVTIRTKDSDAVARYLLTATSATDLEIVAHSLEDAFVELTSSQRPVPVGA